MDKAAYLGVSRSVLGRRWADRLDEAAARESEMISRQLDVPSILARLLAGRGATLEDAARRLEPRLRDWLPDPSTVLDLDKAVFRLARAIETGERVAIFGDYDVDGACSAALLGHALRHAGLDPLIHIPDRLTEGYGPNAEAIRQLRGRGATLLVCVDCGTSGHAPLAEARSIGMDVLVLDHHQAPEVLPDVEALVNPNRLDDLSGLGHLCAAGVVFLVLVGLNRQLRGSRHALPELMSQLDLVALATVADVVPLTGLNRAYVAQGLKIMRARERPGLVALADVSRLDAEPEAWHLGYLLGPRINAGGRIGDSALGARLLMSEDRDEAARIATQLDHLNRERQAVEEAMLAEAEDEAIRLAGLEGEGRAVLVVAGGRWHPGIVGIVAGRLKERFQRPAFAFAPGDPGLLTGSGRSISGVDLGAAVRLAVESGLARKGGGHAMAAGITLDETGLAAFSAFLEERLAAAVAISREADFLRLDAALTAESLTPDFVTEIQRAGPFGQGNPEPLFALPAHTLLDLRELRNGHLRITLASQGGARLEAMAFRAGGRPLGEALAAHRGRKIHAAVSVSRDMWGGKPRVSARLVDFAPAG
ncbi:single-stranded-DNA-specific exonuclease RecJ [Rhabdaerophilum sp. SD176]|uniref:single-stranded-DNA-specific exonuclease RecJ n=1 Tax=Rhabdaerophilum sp. SD176 TaxID=2983548 RepID=UPI0024DF39FE|nr:single-stranded-DNA-specific exonuclease RecJ [Rhabdaerophilum sp. SD176]